LNLSEQYKNSGKISLLLGAGVSCSANLPSWDELISSLFITYLINSHSDKKEYYGMGVNEYIESITQLSKNFSEKYLKSALLSARYLRTGFSSQTDNSIEFISELQQTLYKKEIKNSTLIQTIGKLCIPTRTGAKIRSIITYNFDNLIEQHLETINLKYKSIFLDNDKYENEELPIYHVHGYIPKNT
ncbi:SIR2 family protein, partial [Acinetobacter oleivorans]|uniref:SIR2 family protein n=1 Tax=Acinetobacter oleivorans TaxID=1148157 RepID=UPI00148F0FAE